MKQIYILAIALFVLPFQINAQEMAPNAPALKIAPELAQPARMSKPLRSAQRDIIWQEDFSEGLDSPNGPWTTGGNDGEIWTYTNSVAPACWSGNGDQAVNFSTRENGFMIYHPDEVNCNDPSTDPPLFDEEIYTGQLISPSIDLSDISAVLLSFEHRFRYCCDNSFAVWMSVSTDGGTSWINFDVTGGTATNDFNSESFSTTNITQIAANQSDVRLKFTWNATGTASHYFWAVDDITIEYPVDNDVELMDFNYQQFDINTATNYANLKHTIFPLSQVRPLNLQGFAVNKGALPQSGVVMNATITSPSETISLTTEPQTIAVGDTGVFEIPYTPMAELGELQIVYDMILLNEDDLPFNNSDSTTILIDENFFARDDRSSHGAFTNYQDDLRTALAYTLTEPATIYGVGVALDQSSDIGTFFNGQLLSSDFGFLAETDFAIVEESMLNAPGDENFVHLVLEQPYIGAIGEALFPAFVFSGGQEQANIALSGDCPDQTCFVWAVTASSGQSCDPCFYNSVPMVRPLFAETVGLKDVLPQNGIKLGQNVPNPARDYTIIVVEFDKNAAGVLLEVHDLQGKLIHNVALGNLPAGRHTETLNTTSMKAGMYLYSVTADGARQTKRMTVVR